MSITKAIHIRCDECGTWLRDASSGKYAYQQGAIRYARLKGWTHGKRDLCPVCILVNKKQKTVPQIFEEPTL